MNIDWIQVINAALLIAVFYLSDKVLALRTKILKYEKEMLIMLTEDKEAIRTCLNQILEEVVKQEDYREADRVKKLIEKLDQ